MKKKINKVVFLSYCYTFFINGLLALMTGSILTYLMIDYNLTYKQVGLLVSVQAIGNLLAVLLAGLIVELLGRKNTLIAIGVLFSFGFGGIIFTTSPTILLILLFLTGAGWGINMNVINVLVSEATDGDTAYVNILHMSYAVGAFMAPLFVSVLASWGGSWKIAVASVALAASLLILIYIKLPIEEAGSKLDQAKSKKKIKLDFDFLKDPKYMIYMTIFFCYVGAEMGLNSWLITYLVQQGAMEIEKAPLMLSILWVTIIFGRIATAYISRYIRKDLLLASSSLFMFLTVGLFLINKDPKLLILLMVGIGLSMAGLYPTTVANAGYILAKGGLASGVLLAGGGLGASVVPYLVGVVAENKGILQGLISTLIVIFIMVILAFANVILIRKERVR